MSTKLLVFNHTASIVYVKKYPKSGLKQFNYVFFFFLNDGRSKLASFFYHFLIVYQASYLFAAIETGNSAHAPPEEGTRQECRNVGSVNCNFFGYIQ